jgi:hypothetical protein
MKSVLAIMSLVVGLMTVSPAFADYEALPNTGTYFITNAANQEALQPAASSVGQNVETVEYSKSGSQKWLVTRKIDPKTDKPLNKYTIRLAGDNADLKLQPHPAIDSKTIISTDGAVFSMDPGEQGLLLKKSNGDALYSKVNPPMASEACWGADDGSPKFRWSFVPAN